jgi:hypothetical protein
VLGNVERVAAIPRRKRRKTANGIVLGGQRNSSPYHFETAELRPAHGNDSVPFRHSCKTISASSLVKRFSAPHPDLTAKVRARQRAEFAIS